MDTNRRSTGRETPALSRQSPATDPLARLAWLRTWPAYLLAVCCPGTGHLYSRRWARGVSWLALYAAAFVFLSSGVALADGGITNPMVVLTLWFEAVAFADVAVPLAIVVINVVDLYALAVLDRRSA